MPTLNEDKNIFVTRQGDVGPWSGVPGHKQIQVKAESELRRGFNYYISASESERYNLVQTLLNKWVNLKLFAYVKGEATLQTQLQAPLNLFVEAGLAARIQAIARLAVGFGLSLEMKPEELQNKLKLRPDMEGFLGDLTEVLLQETNLEARLYGEAAVAVMAHLNTVFTGSLLKNGEFEEPGFRFIFDYGYGFKGGGGYRFLLDFKFPDTRKMINRVSDLIVRRLIRSLEIKVNLGGKSLEDVRSFELFLKIALRMAYEIGDEISRKYFVASDTFSPRATKIIVEEGQRWFLQRFMSFGINEFKRLLQGANIIAPQVITFVNNLEAFSKKEDISSENWYEIVNNALGISAQIEGISSDKAREWNQTIAMIWSAAYLADVVTSHVYKEETLHKYTGALNTQPPNEIRGFINTQINKTSDEAFTEEKLISFLLRNPLNNFLNRQRDGNDVLNLFKAALSNPNVNAVEALFNYDEENFGAPKVFLGKITGAFQSQSGELISKVKPIVQRAFPGSTGINAIFNQALVPAVEMTAEVVLPEIINNLQGIGRTELQEALSSVLLSVLAKTMLQVIDTMLETVMQNIPRLLTQAADIADEIGIIRLLRRMLNQSDLKAVDTLLKEALKAAAENLGPFSQQQRKEFFGLLEDILNPIPQGDIKQFVNNLKRPGYISKEDDMKKLALHLINILSNGMYSFSKAMIPKLFDVLLEFIRQQLIKFLENFKNLVIEVKDSIYDKVHDTALNKLTDIFLPMVESQIDAVSISSLPLGVFVSEIRSLLRDKARGAVSAAIGQFVLSPLKNTFTAIEFSTDTLLGFLKSNDLTGFQNYLVNTASSQLTKNINISNPGFSLSIPVSKLGFSRDIPLGSFAKPKNEIINVLRQSLSEALSFSDLFQKLIPAANDVFNAQNEIANLQTEKGTAVQTFHQGLLPLRKDDLNPRIAVRHLGYRGYQTPIELTFHYPGLSTFYIGNQRFYPNVLIFLNNRKLPINSFCIRNFKECQIDSGICGLTLSRIIHPEELQYGINTVYTYIPDNNGGYRQFFYTFCRL